MGERIIKVDGKDCQIIATQVRLPQEGWTIDIVYPETDRSADGDAMHYGTMLFATEQEALDQGEIIARSKAGLSSPRR